MPKMNRLVLAALAVFGAGAAMAQSSVTLYGRINTTVERQKLGDVSNTVMQNNASRWGVRGTEDLGDGLKAGFVLESGFSSDTGAADATFFGRQSEVNLEGGFGMLRLGNYFPGSYFAIPDYVSMHNHDTGPSSDALYVDPNWMGAGVASQYGAGGLGTKNRIGYSAPTFGGFSAEGSMSLHEKTAGTNNKNGYDLAANYNAGPLALGGGYSYWNNNWQAALRAAYTLGQFTVGGYYQRNDDDLLGSRNNFRLSGMYVLGASEFHANVGRANKWSKLSDSGATQWTLGYNYNLSKRTKVYGYYTRINNDGNASYGYDATASGGAGQNFSSFALGVRHNF
ncbi:porin [Comamonas composti]|uniref:porin n=1 Tax=Comamonas composti TaxID=408558 RepID=UPI0003FD8918|nr:porin [Comamonas composti]